MSEAQRHERMDRLKGEMAQRYKELGDLIDRLHEQRPWESPDPVDNAAAPVVVISLSELDQAIEALKRIA
jgi:hypothetical protein